MPSFFCGILSDNEHFEITFFPGYAPFDANMTDRTVSGDPWLETSYPDQRRFLLVFVKKPARELLLTTLRENMQCLMDGLAYHADAKCDV